MDRLAHRERRPADVIDMPANQAYSSAVTVLDVRFVTFLLYLLFTTAFVGFFSGMALAFLWALRCALGLESARLEGRLEPRRALRGFGLLVSGLLTGGAVVLGVGAVAFLTVVLVTEFIFGDSPPAEALSVIFLLLVGVALAVAARFALWWRRTVWIRVLAEER